MKKLIILLIIPIGATAIWSIAHKHKMAVSGQGAQSQSSPPTISHSQTTPVQGKPKSGASPTPRISFTKPTAGDIIKYESVKKAMQRKNKKSLDVYGKVIDQDGNPVIGAKVEAGVMTYEEWGSAGGKEYFTTTDSEGRFQFLGIKGADMGLIPSKEGYIYDQKLSSTARPGNYVPNPDNLLIFK